MKVQESESPKVRESESTGGGAESAGGGAEGVGAGTGWGCASETEDRPVYHAACSSMRNEMNSAGLLRS